MQKILVIKTGAAGDVVRTTSLLNVLKGDITWIVDPKNQFIFPDQYNGLRLITDIETASIELKDEQFDLVLSLEEDENCARLASAIAARKLVGVHLGYDGLSYTDQPGGWFDMSLLSRRGKETANALKRTNPYSFQHWLFRMIGEEFKNEPYIIYRNPAVKRVQGLVGVETRAGNTWPDKAWDGYDQLIRLIEQNGYRVRTFSQKENIRDYFDEIASCSYIISGDSLPMHVALAYKIPCIAIFNCTPPGEIYDYGLLTKMKSPLLDKDLYSKKYNPEVVNSISVEEVIEAFNRVSLPK